LGALILFLGSRDVAERIQRSCRAEAVAELSADLQARLGRLGRRQDVALAICQDTKTPSSVGSSLAWSIAEPIKRVAQPASSFAQLPPGPPEVPESRRETSLPLGFACISIVRQCRIEIALILPQVPDRAGLVSDPQRFGA